MNINISQVFMVLLQFPDTNRYLYIVSTGKFYHNNGGGHGTKVSNLRTMRVHVAVSHVVVSYMAVSRVAVSSFAVSRVAVFSCGVCGSTT